MVSVNVSASAAAQVTNVANLTVAGIFAATVNDTTNISAPATFTLNPPSASPGNGASTGSVAVIASLQSATWTATSNASWITVTSGATGIGNGTVNYSIAANTGVARNGTITIAGQT